MLREQNTSNVQSVNFGYRKTMDAVIWHVVAHMSSVIDAEVNTVSVIAKTSTIGTMDLQIKIKEVKWMTNKCLYRVTKLKIRE